MKLLAYIKSKLSRFKEQNPKNNDQRGCSERLVEGNSDDEPLLSFLDGLGPVTVREIVKRRIDKCIIDEYGIEELANTDRYYIARRSEAKGSVIHSLLVDKQSGMTRSLYRKVNG